MRLWPALCLRPGAGQRDRDPRAGGLLLCQSPGPPRLRQVRVLRRHRAPHDVSKSAQLGLHLEDCQWSTVSGRAGC